MRKFTHEDFKMIAGMLGIVGSILTMILTKGLQL